MRSYLSIWKVLILLQIAGIHLAYSQEVVFRHYSSDEGFIGSAFKTIVQDSLGFLWISSGSGISRFDGYHFTNYQSSFSGNISLLPDPGPKTTILRTDGAGNVWAALRNYVASFDRNKDAFVAYKIASNDSKIESLLIENQNTIWIGTAGKGLYRFEVSSKEVSFYLNETEKKESFYDNNTIRDIVDQKEFLLLATKNGLWMFDKRSETFSKQSCRKTPCLSIANPDVKKIFVHPNYMWLWVDQQLIKLDAEQTILHRFDLNTIQKQFDFEKKFIDARVMEITEYNDGTFWIASQGLGLSWYDPEKNYLKNYRNDKNDQSSIPSDVLNHVMIDRNNNVWTTTVNKGIVQLRKPSLVFHNYLKGMSSTGVGVIGRGDDVQILVGTNGSGLWKSDYDGTNISNLKFQRVELNSNVRGFENVVELNVGKKNVWLGSMQAGVAGLSLDHNGEIDRNPLLIQHDINNKNTISDDFIVSLWEDPEGHVWIGTFNGGLNIVDVENYGTPGSVVNYQHNNSDTSSVINNGVSGFMPDDNGAMFIATFGGLDRVYDARQPHKNFQFEHLIRDTYCKVIHKTQDGSLYVTTRNGFYVSANNGGKYNFKRLPNLPNGNLTYMEEDGMGRLWIMSFDGLFYYDRHKDFALVFKKDDGLPSSRSVAAGTSAQTSDGIMVFGNGEGLTLFDPFSLRINQAKPKPLITAIKINNQLASAYKEEGAVFQETDINTIETLTLDHTHQILSLEFSAMDLTTPEKNIYKFKLDEFDKNWITTDWKNRTATYTNLIPGRYIFRIKATNRDGVWSDHETTLSIIVLPPPWKTWWAYTLYTLLFLTLLYAARRNIIQRERLASKLKLEHLELEKTQEVDRLRSTFFTNISHEFRTPLTLIQGPAQNMIDKLKNEKQLKSTDALPQLDLILVNSNRLLRLVNQVLELSKLESGGLKKEFSEEDIFAFLKMVIGHFSLLSVQKRISLNALFPDQLVISRFDKDKLEKILSNLIFNALKFTRDNGSIIITVRIQAGSQENNYLLLIDVKDNGVGIPEDQVDRVFERFFQVKEGDNQNVGAGIGLALSKELAEFLGGTLSVVSKPSEGSTFTLSLPMEVLKITEIVSVRPPIPLPLALLDEDEEYKLSAKVPNTKPLLLIVEDHVELRKFICLCLGDEYEYLEAGNGKEGLVLAIEQLPSLILSDVMMPEIDGVAMCNKIKQDHRTNHIPVILLTAKASNESKLQGLDKGADDYIIKPFNKQELVLKIRNQILAMKRIQERIRFQLLSGSTVINAVSADEKFIARVKEVIESRISDEQLGVESLAEEIGLSRVQLYRKVNALTGISVNDFIRKLRIQKGAQLLSQNWGSIAEIAYEVGFSNPSYFSKCFKDHFGVIPSSYNSQKT